MGERFRHPASHRVADELFRRQVLHSGEIQPPLVRPDVGDVGNVNGPRFSATGSGWFELRNVPDKGGTIWDRLEVHDVILGEIKGPWDGEPELDAPGRDAT